MHIRSQANWPTQSRTMAAKKRNWKRKLKHSTRALQGELSVHDVRFCNHFAASDNLTEAYRQAGYPNSVGTPHAVCMAAKRKMKNRYIREYIRLFRQQAADAEGVTVALLAQGFRQQAFADRTAIFNADGSMKHPREWPIELRSIIAGIEVIPPKRPGGKPRYKVRFESGTEAKKVLANWRGMINSDIPAGGPAPKRVNIINDEGKRVDTESAETPPDE